MIRQTLEEEWDFWWTYNKCIHTHRVVAVHEVWLHDTRQACQGDSKKCIAHDWDNPVDFLHDSNAKHKNASRAKDGGNDDHGQSHFRLKDTIVAPGRPLGEHIVEIPARVAADQIADELSDVSEANLRSREVVWRTPQLNR